jgi:predicted nucleic acid-binding protein
MYILKLLKKFNDYFSNEWEKEVEPVLHTYKIYNVNPKSKKIKKPKSKNTNN